MDLHFTLNGERAHATLRAPTDTLLTWLRGAGLTGTKEGCAEGECGACAVVLLRTDAHGRPYYEAVNSCLLPLAAVDAQTVLSVEGVAATDGTLHPVQAALVAYGGSQCGYCTPGFVMSMFAEYYRPERVDFDLEAIAGNLCRCTGYRPIIDAARSLPTPAVDDPHLPTQALLRHPLAPPATPRDAAFLRPRTLEELFSQRARYPDAPLVAGGTDLMVAATQRGEHPAHLIALDAIEALQTFTCAPHELTLGAGLPLSRLGAALAEQPDAAPLLIELLPLFSSRLIRNRATLGGNLQTASPIGDAAPCLLALDAELTLAGPTGTRRIPLSSFFLDYRKTALAADELIVSVHVPLPAPPRARFYKVSKRVLDDISIVAAAFALELTTSGEVARLRIAYGGVAATPLRAHAAEALAMGRPLDDATKSRVCEALAETATPISDHRGSAAYRRALMPRLFERFWAETVGTAEATS